MVFSGPCFCEFKAPHFCSKLVQSSTANDFTSLELHGNGQNSHDFNVFIIDLKGFQNVFPGLQPAQKSWSFCFEEPSTCSLSTLSQKLHVFVRGRVNKIVWVTCKLTTLEWKLHGFFRAIYYEIKAPHFCPKFVQSSTATWLYKPWAPRKRSKFKRF